MSTIILLSSSPPPVFAPSPTPIRSSPPPSSGAVLLQGCSPGKSKFKVKEIKRDGFSSPFSTARQVLAQKTGTENVMNTSARKNKFRLSQEKGSEDKDDKELDGRWRKTKPGVGMSKVKAAEQIEGERPESYQSKAKTTVLDESWSAGGGGGDGGVVAVDKSVDPESILLERAVARRLDWTPPKSRPHVVGEEEKPTEYSVGFINGMLSNFKHNDASTRSSSLPNEAVPNPPKRRRVDKPHERKTDAVSVPPPKLTAAKSISTKPKPRSSRSPAKKPLTITGLATSNYLGDDDAPESSLVQYLISTQAQLNNTSADSALETEVHKTKAAASKLRIQRKKQPKSLLVSPQSAMKSFDAQEAIFGSASQLAQDESPAFLREIIEATKQSESFIMSDPFSSPQRTPLGSVDNTPKAGVSRFRRTRDLWSAAGRDVDNALLHVDTIDLTDTPAVRAAFAGKDVMVQSGANPASSTNKPALSLKGGFSPLMRTENNKILDINDITTPNIIPTRPFCSSARSASPREPPVRVQASKSNEPQHSRSGELLAENPVPSKPNYAGLTVRELNKQITAFGFKAMRKREKMIELLDRCWEEKHGSSKPAELEPKVLPYGNFLSDVHDISARPQPKPKKSVTRKKKEKDVAANPSDETAKKPRQRKKKALDDEINAQPKPKAPRKRKAKVSSDVHETVMDVDQLWDRIPEELRALETFDDWAKPERKARTKKTLPASENAMDTLKPPPTPPPTIPASTVIAPPPTIENDLSIPEDQTQVPTLLPTPPQHPPSQIAAAIMHQSRHPEPGRNHIVDPTWHEKILLYDPIVLEDLATWLNTEGLAAVGEDGEVSALEVREWCESHGVCCLWRGGWRGNKQTS